MVNGQPKLKSRVYQILEPTGHCDRTTVLVMVLITGLIIFSVLSVIIESIESIYQQYQDFFKVSEFIVVAAFTIEYVLRLWSCTVDPRYQRPIIGRLKYALTVFLILDLLAILPFYLPLFITFDSRFLRALRLVRFLRIGKLARYSHSVGLLTRVVRRQKETLIVTLLFIVILIVFASCLMWQVEYEVQPDKFSSIPDTMWWAVATVTTVGYGDIVPITPLGKFLGAFIAMLGVGMIAMPAGIIVSGFIDEAKEKEERDHRSHMREAKEEIDLLERLVILKEKGIITEDELAQQKAKILHGQGEATHDQREWCRSSKP